MPRAYAARSSYATLVRKKPKRGNRELAEAATPITQEERVQWAERRLRSAIARSSAKRNADPVLVAAVAGRRRELEREIATLERLTGIRIPPKRKR